MKIHFRSSLLKSYIIIVFVVCIVLITSFLLFYKMTENRYAVEAEATARKLFQQEEDALTQFEQKFDNIFSLITSNDSTVGYLSAEDFAEYTGRRYKIDQLAGNLVKMNMGIKSIVLYNNKGIMIGMVGSVFFPEEGISMGTEYGGFSNRLMDVDDDFQYTYFHVEYPVYSEEGKSWSRIGSVGLLVGTENLQEIVDVLSVSNGGYAAVLDREKQPLVQAGENTGYEAIMEEGKEDDSCLIYRYTSPESGWELINIVPRSTFMDYPEDVQKITLSTYGFIFAALVLLCFLIYSRVIRPIRRQMDFVVGYTRDTRQRIEVVENNEFGELARRINQMLDELEALNHQVIEGERKLLQMEYAKKQTEMIAYKSQINPHFMYNTLECIRGMALYKGEKEIARLTGSLSKLFRYNVKGKELVTIREVAKNLREYAMIIDYRFMGKFQVQITLQNEALALRYIPKMLVQPLLENAVLHGLEPNLRKGTVRVFFSEGDCGGIRIDVEDDGCGIEEEMLEKIRTQMNTYDEDQAFENMQHGIGISNVYRRMRLFYGAQASFDIYSIKGEGTRIVMCLPEEMTGQKE